MTFRKILFKNDEKNCQQTEFCYSYNFKRNKNSDRTVQQIFFLKMQIYIWAENIWWFMLGTEKGRER